MFIRIGMISAAPATLGVAYRILVLSGRRSGGRARVAETEPLLAVLAAILTLACGGVVSTGGGSFDVTNSSAIGRGENPVMAAARLNLPRRAPIWPRRLTCPPQAQSRRDASRRSRPPVDSRGRGPLIGRSCFCIGHMLLWCFLPL